jgi:hypothetical protein
VFQEVPEAVEFTLSGTAHLATSGVLTALRVLTVPLILVCAATIASGATGSAVLPVVAFAAVSMLASVALAITERSRFLRLD